jgi:hypothetical protein
MGIPPGVTKLIVQGRCSEGFSFYDPENTNITEIYMNNYIINDNTLLFSNSVKSIHGNVYIDDSENEIYISDYPFLEHIDITVDAIVVIHVYNNPNLKTVIVNNTTNNYNVILSDLPMIKSVSGTGDCEQLMCLGTIDVSNLNINMTRLDLLSITTELPVMLTNRIYPNTWLVTKNPHAVITSCEFADYTTKSDVTEIYNSTIFDKFDMEFYAKKEFYLRIINSSIFYGEFSIKRMSQTDFIEINNSNIRTFQMTIREGNRRINNLNRFLNMQLEYRQNNIVKFMARNNKLSPKRSIKKDLIRHKLFSEYLGYL